MGIRIPIRRSDATCGHCANSGTSAYHPTLHYCRLDKTIHPHACVDIVPSDDFVLIPDTMPVTFTAAGGAQ